MARTKKSGTKRKRNKNNHIEHTQKKQKTSSQQVPFQVGVYEIVRNTVATTDIDRNSTKQPGTLSVGQRVNVVEIKEFDERIRARLENGGWISIESTCANHWIWAKRVIGELLFPVASTNTAPSPLFSQKSALSQISSHTPVSKNGGIFTSSYIKAKNGMQAPSLKTKKDLEIAQLLFPPTSSSVPKDSLKISKEPEPLFPQQQEAPLAFMKPYEKILVLGEEDFSLSYDLSQVVPNSKITATEFASNFESTSFGKKLLELGHEIRNNIDATKIGSFPPEDKTAYDACLFAFPRCMASIDHLKTMKYHEINEKFTTELLNTLFQLLKPEGKVFLILLPTQVRLWNVETHVKERNWGMRELGLFEFSRLMHYRPRNETGAKWEPYGSRVYEFSSKPLDAADGNGIPADTPNPYLQAEPL